jgi:hypothetical protein
MDGYRSQVCLSGCRRDRHTEREEGGARGREKTGDGCLGSQTLLQSSTIKGRGKGLEVTKEVVGCPAKQPVPSGKVFLIARTCAMVKSYDRLWTVCDIDQQNITNTSKPIRYCPTYETE